MQFTIVCRQRAHIHTHSTLQAMKWKWPILLCGVLKLPIRVLRQPKWKFNMKWNSLLFHKITFCFSDVSHVFTIIRPFLHTIFPLFKNNFVRELKSSWAILRIINNLWYICCNVNEYTIRLRAKGLFSVPSSLTFCELLICWLSLAPFAAAFAFIVLNIEFDNPLPTSKFMGTIHRFPYSFMKEMLFTAHSSSYHSVSTLDWLLIQM